MVTTVKSIVDPSKITGIYTLLALFLIVVEVLLALWISRAEDTTERVISGTCMVLIFGGFLLLIYGMSKRGQLSERYPPQDVGSEFNPAKKDTTEAEIVSLQPESERIGASDGSYSINKPPQDWITRELTYSDWIGEMWQIPDPSARQQAAGLFKDLDTKILTLKSRHQMSFIPIVGTTRFNERKIPSALEVMLPVQISIIRLDRAQPPFYIEQSLEHNVLTVAAAILSTGILTIQAIQSGVTDSGRRRLSAIFVQEIKDGMINGTKKGDINSNLIVIGIEGELYDHQLFMHYPSVPAGRDPELEQDVEILRSLVNSFQPLKFANASEKRKEISDMADRKFEELLVNVGAQAFYTELAMLVFRLKGLNLDDPESRFKAMKMLKPFEIFAKEIRLENDDKEFDLDHLWNSLHEAEEGGDTSGFKAMINELIELVDEATSEEASESTPDLVLGQPGEGEDV
jgi:hypothetical protein